MKRLIDEMAANRSNTDDEVKSRIFKWCRKFENSIVTDIIKIVKERCCELVTEIYIRFKNIFF